MRISAINVTKRGRFAIYIDEEYCCSLHPEVFDSANLQAGREIEGEALAALQYESELRDAKSYTLRILTGQDYTARQITDKLTRRHDPQIAAEVVARMEELGLINDESYAERCARDLVNIKKFSTRRVAQELHRRGISAEAIEAALEQFSQEDSRERIAQVLLLRYETYAQDDRVKSRAVGGLSRLGYRYEDIAYVMRHIEEFAQE